MSATGHIFSHNQLPRLLSFFTEGAAPWMLHVEDIGANCGFPGAFDWNEVDFDDDGALIHDDSSPALLKGLPGFLSSTLDRKEFSALSFRRRTVRVGDVVRYIVEPPTLVSRSQEGEKAVALDTAALFAAMSLQVKLDWNWLIAELSGYPNPWTIEPIFEDVPVANGYLREMFYEIANVASCQYFDGDPHPKPGNFSGFDEARFIKESVI